MITKIKLLCFCLSFCLGVLVSTTLFAEMKHRMSGAQERLFLPNVKATQKWKWVGRLATQGNFAPSVIRFPNGQYRAYFNDVHSRSIISATSSDGISFTQEEGTRLASGTQGEADCASSHPWAVPVAGGYRMFYQGEPSCTYTDFERKGPPQFMIFSAFSEDGLTFKREGVRLNSKANGLAVAAHGRILKLKDGRFRIFFSGQKIGQRGPADIFSAISSNEGLTWEIEEGIVLERGHDPTLIRVGNETRIYTAYLSDNILLLTSSDDKNFVPQTWLEFYDSRGSRLEHMSDIEIVDDPNNGLLIYGSYKGSPGIGVFQKTSE